MAEDASIGIVGSEVFQQLVERVLLGIGAGIGSFAVLVEASLIDNAKATVVVVAGMNALDGFWQQGDDITIAAHIVVVATLAVLGFATGYQVLHAEWAVALIGHAVDNKEFYIFMFQFFHSFGFILAEIAEIAEIL